MNLYAITEKCSSKFICSLNFAEKCNTGMLRLAGSKWTRKFVSVVSVQAVTIGCCRVREASMTGLLQVTSTLTKAQPSLVSPQM